MMKERVHPRDTDSPSNSGGMHRQTLSQDSLMSKDSYAYSGPPSGTYVIQVPKDQVYRLPPPENAHKYKLYTTHKSRRSRCRSCCCVALGLFILLVALLAAAVGVFYLIYRPEAPSFSVSRVSVKGVNVTSSSATSRSLTVSPAFNVTVRAENPIGKIGIHYERGSSVRVYHDDLMLCSGDLPAFYQAAGNVTVFSTELGGSDIVLSSSAREQLAGEEEKGRVPLRMVVKLPVSVRVGSLKTWTMTAKGECAVVLSALTAKAKLVSKDCSITVKPW